MSFKFSAKSPKNSLLIFGLSKPTKTLECCEVQYVIHFPLKKPTNDERKPKVMKKPMVKDRPDNNSPKNCKISQLSFLFEKPVVEDRPMFH